MLTFSYHDRDRIRPALQRGVIVGFPSLTREGLSELCRTFHLPFRFSELTFCQTEYAKTGKNAPTVDELVFLGAVSRGKHLSGDFVSISHVYMNDPEGMRTYRSLMDRAPLLDVCNGNAPIRLSDALTLLRALLERSGRELDFGGTVPVADPFEAVLLTGARYLPEDGISLLPNLPVTRFFRAPETGLPIPLSARANENDALLVISDRVSDGTPSETLIPKLAAFAGTEFYARTVHAVRAVDRKGLAVALSHLSDGIYTELHRIPSVFDEGELYDLACAEHGNLLVALSQENAQTFTERAAEFGLSAVQIARAVRGTCLTVRREGHPPFTFRTEFLRAFATEAHPSLFEYAAYYGEEPVTAVRTSFTVSEAPRYEVPQAAPDGLPESDPALSAASAEESESPITAPAVSEKETSEEECPDPAPTFAVISNGRVRTAAGVARHSFRGAMNVAVALLLESVLAGADPDRIAVADGYLLPRDLSSESLGELLASALGVYRVLAETAIPNRSSILSRSCAEPLCNGSETDGALTLVATAPASSPKLLPRHFVSSGSPVYLVTMPKDGRGFFDFEGVRSTLRGLAELAKKGKIRSVSVASAVSPIETVNAMCGEYGIRYTGPEDLNAAERDVFLVLEADGVVGGMHAIGVTKALPKTEV